MTYLQHFKDRYPYAEQIGLKQMAVIRDSRDNFILFSYYTPVGYNQNDVWYITNQRYSVTTSKQISLFSRNHEVQSIPHDQFVETMRNLGYGGLGWNS
jgi:hypothetical protein